MKHGQGQWCDIVRHGPVTLGFCPQGMWNGSNRINRWDLALAEIPGHKLRVYRGTYGDPPHRLVCISNCTPEGTGAGEKYGRAVFIGPREDAIDAAKFHAAMWL